MHGPGLVARCSSCEQVMLRVVSVRQRMLLDIRGMTYLGLNVSEPQNPGR